MKGLTENAISSKLQENETILPRKDIQKVIDNCITSILNAYYSFSSNHWDWKSE